MADYLEKLKGYAADYLDEKGLQVHVKTDFGPAIKIYDADDPAGDNSPLPIKYSVALTNRNGKVIKQYNPTPATNPIKAGIVVAVVGAGVYFILAGMYSTLKQVIE